MATGSSEVASPNARLVEKDLPELLRVLHPARIEYNSFGLQIGVGVGEIACIEQTHKDPRHCLCEILTARLKKSEPLTWSDIVAALREECVGLGRIADDIREKHAHLFTPTISMTSEYEHGKQFDKVVREADSEDDEKETCRQRHESICEQDLDEEVGGREERTQPLRKRESKHEIKSKGILKQKEYASIKKTGRDHRARVSKERERSSEYEGIETVRSKKHVQEVESEDEEGSVLSRKERGKKGKGKGGKPAHDKEKQVHGKERAKRMNKKEKFIKDEFHSEPEEVREKSKQKKKATHDQEESVSDHNHYSDSEVCGKRVKKGSRKREVNIESESEASSDEEEIEGSSLEDDTSHKESAKRKPVTKHTEMKIKVQKEHREDRKDKKDAKSRDIRYSDETKKLSRSKKVETESDEESSSASSSDEEEIEVTKHIDNSKHTETKSADRTKDTTHFESEEKGKTSGKKRVSLKPQSTTAVSPCSELYKDKRGKKAIKVGKSIDSSKETYHKTSSKHQREDQEEKKEVVSGKKGTAPPLERDLPSSEMAETDSGDGESDESSEDEEQKSSDEEEETEYYDCSPAEEREEKGKIMSRHIKEKDQVAKKEVVSAKKETPPCLERDLPSSEMAETDSRDGESDESSEDENESEQKSSDEEEETENDDSSSVEGKEEKGSEKSPKSKQKASTLTTTTEMRKTKSQDDDENSKQKKSSKALSKDDSHGDKEESDSGGSRDQEDQPKKRNRRRHRERSKTPIVRGGSSPSSSQEERKKRNKRGREQNKKSYRKKRERKVKDGASGTDDSSPECDMVNQSEVEKKELASVFERYYGQLCCVEFNPKEIAAQLQKKSLISIPLMKELIVSPESQQAKIITLIDALYEIIKSHPEHLFSCIEVMFKNDALQEAGRELLTEAGKQKPSCE